MRQHFGNPINIWCVVYSGPGHVNKLHFKRKARLDRRGVWERMDIRICITESLFCPPENIITLLIGYTPIQN